ncbi:MAG TPA: S-methyl-5-thioribose-1-phosphate isomerase [candidate division Zixibacteria bacterium]|nr:S-methyl-5-thioribose-1-phosphate isomerase [candidate division Zixibacteria bacterium]
MHVEAIKTFDHTLLLLAQTRLPAEFTYLELADYHEVIEAIKRLDVRGAPAIGIAAAYGLGLAVEQAGKTDWAAIDKLAREIKAARPTAVNLAWAVDRVMERVRAENSTDLETIVELIWSEARAIHEEDRLMCDDIGRHGAELIQSGDTILTHCNAGALATGGSGTALAVIYECHKQGKKIKVYADETRPLLQGARLTSWELQQAGIDVTLICDSVAAMLMQQGKIDHVIVGTDRIAANGDFANKIGTYSVAVNAARHNVPFYVAAPESTIDEHSPTGADIIIEERSEEEVTCGFGTRTAPLGISVYNPAFDVTPADLVSYYIYNTGLRKGPRCDRK